MKFKLDIEKAIEDLTSRKELIEEYIAELKEIMTSLDGIMSTEMPLNPTQVVEPKMPTIIGPKMPPLPLPKKKKAQNPYHHYIEKLSKIRRHLDAIACIMEKHSYQSYPRRNKKVKLATIERDLQRAGRPIKPRNLLTYMLRVPNVRKVAKGKYILSERT